MTRHSLVSHSSIIRATTATGIACTMAMLEQQRKTAVRPRPEDRDPFDPAPLAGDPRHPRMQVGFVLKEVQVPPGLVLAVVGRTAGNAALRAGEPAAPCLRRGQPCMGPLMASGFFLRV